jgi:hypothetical protein
MTQIASRVEGTASWTTKPQMRAKQVLYKLNQPIHTIYFPDNAVICQMTVMSDGDTLETGTVGLEGASWISASIGAPSIPCERMLRLERGRVLIGDRDRLFNVSCDCYEVIRRNYEQVGR